MHIGLVPEVRTQALGWRFQEVHCCPSDVASLAILQVSNRARAFCPYIYGLIRITVNRYQLMAVNTRLAIGAAATCMSHLPWCVTLMIKMSVILFLFASALVLIAEILL